MRHAACFGLSIASLLFLAWGCGDDTSDGSSTGDPPIPCETDRDCAVTDNPCARGFCEGSKKECVFRNIESGPQPGAEQTPGDCLSINCVAGVSTVVPSNDPPDDDGLDCLVPTCNNGEIGERQAPVGTSCMIGANQGVCNAGGVCSCAPLAGEAQFVDPVLGTDSPNNGGARGGCAYKTLTYALSRATNDIRIKAGDYSAATGETLPFVLSGVQRLFCYDQGANESAKLIGSGTAQSVEATVIVSGTQNRVEGCVIEAGGATNGIAVVSEAPNNSHQLRSNDISGAVTGIAVLAAADNVQVRDCNLHDNTGFGLDFQGPNQSGSLENNVFATNGVDIRCADASPDIMGTGNGNPSCQVCQNCPF
jgi:hypothetical protein